MERAEFDRMVARLEIYSKAHPRGYRLRVLGFALLGYAYLTMVILLLLALLLAAGLSVLYLKALGIKLLVVIGPIVWLVLRGCWVDMSAPKGLVVTRRTTPALFEHIDALRQKLRAPRFHRVLITDDFNAGVMEVPRLGPFGWHARYLLLGMPLLRSVTPDQLDAILAHEFGHLAGGHARFSNWLYRLRIIWSQILGELDKAGSSSVALFKGFFEWYVPRFHAYSFPLARANEFEADAAAVLATSPGALAEALTTTAVVSRYLDAKYWPTVYARTGELPHPSFAPYAGLGEALSDDVSDAEAGVWLRDTLAQTTGTTDTHPALADRLRAFDGVAVFKRPAANASADVLLGAARESLIAKIDEGWRDRVAEAWHQRHLEISEGRARLQQLRDAAAQVPASVSEVIERANLEESHGPGQVTAIALLSERIRLDPGDAALNYWLGVKFVAAGDEAGVSLVEKAISLSDDAIVPGAVALRDFHQARGNEELANRAHARAAERQRLLDLAEAERQTVKLGDKLEAHQLDSDSSAPLYRELRRCGAGKIWLARKPMKYFPEQPLFVLAFTVTPWYWFNSKYRAQNVQRRIVEEVALPERTIVVCTDGEFYRFRRKLRRIAGTRLRATGH